MEAIGRLSGGIAHDFNNHLGVIIGYSRVLKKALGSDSVLCGHAAEIEKAGKRAASLTKQLLAFSRQQVLTPAVLSLNDLAQDMGTMFPQLLGEDIQVSLDLDPELGSVKADQSQIEQVIMNLAVNARDAMPAGGKLHLRTANSKFDQAYTPGRTQGPKAGDYVLLAISDSGTGIDAAHARAYLPSHSSPPKCKARVQDWGLRRSTVSSIKKQSDGYIWVESAPGAGLHRLKFIFRAAPAPGPRKSRRSNESKRCAARKRFFSSRMRCRCEFLRRHSWKRRDSQFSPQRGAAMKPLRRIAASFGVPIHLLLTDVVMPGMNGRVLAEQLLRRYPGMKRSYTCRDTQTALSQRMEFSIQVCISSISPSRRTTSSARRARYSTARRRPCRSRTLLLNFSGTGSGSPL